MTKDGKKCTVEMKETSNGIKFKSKGSGCKEMMGKEYFKEVKMEFNDD